MSSSPPSRIRPNAADRIRGSARDLFYRQGIRAVGVDEIVSRAGVTKPSLYRAFESKDGLASVYLDDYQCGFWDRIEEGRRRHPDDPRAQVLAYFDGLAERASQTAYRGCALTNAVVEFPDPDHPVRRDAMRMKGEVRAWLVAQARAMGARDPALLADGLVLLMEGAYGAGQTCAPPGPAAQVGRFARLLVDASCDPPCDPVVPDGRREDV